MGYKLLLVDFKSVWSRLIVRGGAVEVLEVPWRCYGGHHLFDKDDLYLLIHRN